MLKHNRFLLVGLVLLAMPGCVELTGQRITWSYDAAKDELQIVLFYDGVHDSGKDGHGKGAEQLPRFVEHGDFMILDWPFHFDRADSEKLANRPEISTKYREFYRACLAIRTETIGYYREPDSRLGAAQRLTIPEAKKFFVRLNPLIGNLPLDGVKSVMPRTAERMRAATEAGHTWIALDGNAIRIVLPVDPEEWSGAKAEFLHSFAKDVSDALKGNRGDDDRRAALSFIRLLASAPISYLDEGDRVEFRIGLRDKPVTLRLDIRGKYDAGLEDVLKKSVRTDFDAAAAQSLLGEKPASSAVAAALKAMPEAGVGALLAYAERGDDGRKNAVVAALRAWGERWNGEHHLPAAPAIAQSREKSLAAWKAWYEQTKQFPLADPHAK
jgi:hypothetical protein